MAQRLLKKDGRLFKRAGRLVDAAHGDCCCGPSPVECCIPQPYVSGTCGVAIADPDPANGFKIRIGGTLDGFERRVNVGTTTYSQAPFFAETQPVWGQNCSGLTSFADGQQAELQATGSDGSSWLNTFSHDFYHGGNGAVIQLRHNTQWMRAGPFSAPAGDSAMVVGVELRTHRGDLSVLGGANLRTGQAANAAVMFNSTSLAALRANDPTATINATLTGGFGLTMNGCTPTLALGFRWVYSYQDSTGALWEGDLTLAGVATMTPLCSFGNRPGGCVDCPDGGAEVVPV